MKIDIYSHVLPSKFKEAFNKRVGEKYMPVFFQRVPALWDIDARIEIMSKFEGLVQVLTPTGPCLESDARPDDAAYLAKIYNDEMAELVLKYPDRFVAAVACLPLNNIDATLKEIDRAINELGFKGILMNTPVNGQPLDLPQFMPIYERMCDYDLPIWIHPTGLSSVPDYINETESKYELYLILGWPYESSLAMARLVCSGILPKHPNLKFIIHHAGGMISFFAGRIEGVLDSRGISREPMFKVKPPIEYFRMFYADTALDNIPGLMCAHAFFGKEHMLLGTDMPYGAEFGKRCIRQSMAAIERMNISDSDKQKIFGENAKLLLRLDV